MKGIFSFGHGDRLNNQDSCYWQCRIKSSFFVSKGKYSPKGVKSTVYDCTGRVHRFLD